jgi:hypothetical protein
MEQRNEAMARGDTTYSDEVPGARGNYGWPATFDLTDGYLGITQFEGDTVKDRVLLSPRQVAALVAFVSKRK